MSSIHDKPFLAKGLGEGAKSTISHIKTHIPVIKTHIIGSIKGITILGYLASKSFLTIFSKKHKEELEQMFGS